MLVFLSEYVHASDYFDADAAVKIYSVIKGNCRNVIVTSMDYDAQYYSISAVCQNENGIEHYTRQYIGDFDASTRTKISDVHKDDLGKLCNISAKLTKVENCKNILVLIFMINLNK